MKAEDIYKLAEPAAEQHVNQNQRGGLEYSGDEVEQEKKDSYEEGFFDGFEEGQASLLNQLEELLMGWQQLKQTPDSDFRYGLNEANTARIADLKAIVEKQKARF
jgi:hypothetical protein